MKGESQDSALRAEEGDLASIRDAWFRAIRRADSDRLVRAASALFFVYDIRSRFEEAEELLAQTRNAMQGRMRVDRTIAEFVNVAYGWFRIYRSPDAACAQIATAVCALDREPFGALHAVAYVIAAYAGAFPTGAARSEPRILSDDRRMWAEALALGAYVGVLGEDDLDQAERMAMRSFRLRRSLGDRWGASLVLYTLGRLAELGGRLGLARLRFEQCRLLADEAGTGPYIVISSLLGESRVARRSERFGEAAGRHREARVRYEEAFRVFQTISPTQEIAETAALLGDLARETGGADEAEGWYEESLAADSENGPAAEGLSALGRSPATDR